MEREWSLGGSCAESTAQHSGQEVEDERRLWRNKEGMSDGKPRSMDMAVGGRLHGFSITQCPSVLLLQLLVPIPRDVYEGESTYVEEELPGKLLYPEQCGGYSNTLYSGWGYWATAGLQYILCWGAAMAGCGNHELNEFEAFYNIICNANILA